MAKKPQYDDAETKTKINSLVYELTTCLDGYTPAEVVTALARVTTQHMLSVPIFKRMAVLNAFIKSVNVNVSLKSAKEALDAIIKQENPNGE